VSCRPTKPQLHVLKNLYTKQKGLPVGIPVAKGMARHLVLKDLCEYAPCGYLHLLKRSLASIRLKLLGELYAKGVV
jgi:hypothetical protein